MLCPTRYARRPRGFGCALTLGNSRFEPGRMARLFALACLGVLLLVLAAPGCGRSSLESDTLDGGTSNVCSPSTCPKGCCDGAGVCRTGRDTRACGSVGGSCSDCVANGFDVCTSSRVCGRDDPACSSRTCLGCCSFDEGRLRCLSGTEPSACGSSGDECTDCPIEGRACDPSTRVCGSTRCDPSNCDGCCVGDKCLPGDLASACGSKGGQCDTCAAGQSLRRGERRRRRPLRGHDYVRPGELRRLLRRRGQCVTGTDVSACGIRDRNATPAGRRRSAAAERGHVPTARPAGRRTARAAASATSASSPPRPSPAGRAARVCRTCGPERGLRPGSATA